MISRLLTSMELFVFLGMLSAQALGQGRSTAPPTGDVLTEAGFKRHFVEVKDAKLSYVLRKAAGPTLVLIPGSFESADTWLGVVAKFDPELQVVLVELRGHGQS